MSAGSGSYQKLVMPNRQNAFKKIPWILTNSSGVLVTLQFSVLINASKLYK